MSNCRVKFSVGYIFSNVHNNGFHKTLNISHIYSEMWTFLSPRYGKPDVTPLIVYTYYNIWLILGVYFPLISNTLDRKKKNFADMV